jgi:hypothetical protein
VNEQAPDHDDAGPSLLLISVSGCCYPLALSSE